MKHVLTVDIGTTSTKVMLVSESGQVLRSKQSFYATQFPAPGWCEQDPMVVLNAVNELVTVCASGESKGIATISFSCAMHSIMAVDHECTPLSPVIIWSDMRSAEIAKTLKADHVGAELYEETGTPIHPMSPLCKLLWLKENNPDLFRTAFKFISIKEFVIWHLCESWAVDYSLASSTGIFDVRQLAWSAKALGVIGIGIDRLSPTVPPSNTLPLTHRSAKVLGLASETRITMGASDGCLANLGSGATGAGDLAITVGTSGAVRMITAHPAADPQGRLFNYRLDENRFVSGGATNNGTIIIDWFARGILKEKELRMEDFVLRSLSVPAGSEGLLFLPFVFGERAPYHNPDLRGMFFGLAQHHSVTHMMRSVLEGICFEIRSLVAAVDQSVRPADTILASGGFVRSPEWVQLLANILGRQITVRDVNDASSLGAAMMGFESMGLHPAFERQDTEKTFTPDAGVKADYDRTFDIFSRIASKLDDEFSEIASIQTRHVSDIKRKP